MSVSPLISKPVVVAPRHPHTDIAGGSRLASGARRAGRWIVRGPEGTAAWERPALLALLAVTAVLYLWNLGISGWANQFYAAAVQAGTQDWTAFFYGSSDAANSITVDKPPASLWLMALSTRIVGFSSFAMLLPEALMGVASVGVVYATVRRAFTARTALLAGAALALTPVAALMFRFNNPDALLVLLLCLATYLTMRAIESGKVSWLLWAGVAIGFGFLTKQLQAFLILPALAGVYLVASPRKLGTRFAHLFGALGTVVLAAGWWVAIVELVPESWRPYIGGSQDNSFLELTFGYNGLGRLTGNETGSVGGGTAAAGTTGSWGETGIGRLFTSEFAGQFAWLLPAALVLLVVAIVILRKAPRVDLQRATLFLFAGWMLITGLAFSFMAGIFHAYYTVALAPAIAATAAMGASLLWAKRDAAWARIIGAATVLGTSMWAYLLLSYATDWLPVLKFVVLGFGVLAAVLLLFPRRGRAMTVATLAATLVAGLLAPAAYTLDTINTAHTGAIVTAGPSVSGGQGGGMPGGGTRGGGGGGMPGGNGGGTPPTGTTGGTGTGTGTGTATGNATAGGFGGGGGGGAGSILGGGTASAEVVALLQADSSSYEWAAATVGSNNAAMYQLALTDASVMPVGGFNGTDPAPTLTQFQSYVALGQIHYFIGTSTSGSSSSGSDAAAKIAAWVADNYTATTVDGVTVYDLSS